MTQVQTNGHLVTNGVHDTNGVKPEPSLEERTPEFGFEVVQGFFVQNGPKPKHVEFEEILQKSFGLVDQSPERWTNLKASLKKLQDEAPEGVQYKVLFLGRHGQGWHNFGNAKYGDDWDHKWALLTGDDEITWGPDPPLTPLGIQQAQSIYAAWSREVKQGAPVGAGQMKWLVSPLVRTNQTLEASWGELVEGKPEAWEDLREIYGYHTNDLRYTKTELQKRFPNVDFSSITEDDELWTPEPRETYEHAGLRGQRAMDRLFSEGGPSETFISVTAHAAFYRSLLKVLNHQEYELETGEMIPVVVKATKLSKSKL
ncbi:hypothetical protein I350_05160 [Cryptococcus amylolentus CBS 6273]|uniref:Phosphoglycerate mutase n=1 Tax=Cryptococcus amylolentus CBS 6273 TaxID=1296118 RepID=A0A1E3JUW3_9TREE|nr:hypothetical protein I350_05160 [Cryptococcus amylolentus CBS 6273]